MKKYMIFLFRWHDMIMMSSAKIQRSELRDTLHNSLYNTFMCGYFMHCITIILCSRTQLSRFFYWICYLGTWKSVCFLKALWRRFSFSGWRLILSAKNQFAACTKNTYLIPTHNALCILFLFENGVFLVKECKIPSK